MSQLEVGQRITALKALAFSNRETNPGVYEQDSFVLITDSGQAFVVASATDWTLRVEMVAFPKLPDWAWPPEDWRYDDLESPAGKSGFQTIRKLTKLRNEVGEIDGLQIDFEKGSFRFLSGESTSFEVILS